MAKKIKITPMSTKDDLEVNIDNVVENLKHVIMNDLPFDVAKKLVYWINDWSYKYIPNEKRFDYESLIYYKRGNIVKAELGFKIGSEDGGLHYCLVVENNNAKTNKTIMVIPLTSLDESKGEEDIDKANEVYIGKAIFKNEIEATQQALEALLIEREKESADICKIDKKIKRAKKELDNYKKATVAKVNQMCALSKMRIVHPKSKGDALYGFKVDPTKLDEIDKKIMVLYTRQ
jgi:hypothetical protein